MKISLPININFFLKNTVYLTWLMVLLIYGPFITHGQFALRDMNLVVDPLRSIHSISDYIDALKDHRLWDLQPVRDLSYLIDFKLERLLGNRVYPFTNLLVFFGILGLMSRLLDQLFAKSFGVKLVLLLVSVHPIWVNSVCWIAARKHLLSCFFILAATSIWIDNDQSKEKAGRETLWPAVFYALSILSQPITLLWPIWAYLRARRLSRVVMISGLIGAWVGVLNYFYYAGTYASQTGVSKWPPFSAGTLFLGLLAQGRYLFNILFPFQIFPLYNPESILNGVGVLLFLVLIFLVIKKKKAGEWLIFYLIPLLIVTFPITRIFVMDSYALTPMVGLMILGLHYKNEVSLPNWCPKYSGPLLGVILTLGLVVSSFKTTKVWSKDSLVWKQTLQERDTEFARGKLVLALVEEADFMAAKIELQNIETKYPDSQYLPSLVETVNRSREVH